MLQSERQNEILKELADKEFLSVEEAIDLFNASPATIRRDFAELSESKQCLKIRGGIKKIVSSIEIIPFSVREIQNSEEKKSIANAAANLIEEGNVIFVDGGSTTFHLGEAIENKNITLITNSLRLANIITELERKNIECHLTGGYLYGKAGVLLGSTAEYTLKQYNADIVFLSVGGIDENGISNTNALVKSSEEVMIKNANKVVILADHSKIGKKATIKICSLSNVDILITDKKSKDLEIISKIKEKGVDVIFA